LRYWVDPGTDDDLSVDRFCPTVDRQELGRFTYQDDHGPAEALVFRPYAIDVTTPPAIVQQSSNAFMLWHTLVVPTQEGHEVDLPDGTGWAAMLEPLRFHTHHLGLPVEVRRFATDVVTVVGRGQGKPVERRIRFVSEAPGATYRQAGLGFVVD